MMEVESIHDGESPFGPPSQESSCYPHGRLYPPTVERVVLNQFCDSALAYFNVFYGSTIKIIKKQFGPL